jgi:AraC-like DNA-binding protein
MKPDGQERVNSVYFKNIVLKQDIQFVRKLAEFKEHDVHTHDALEISVLLEQDAIYHLLDRDYKGMPGDVFVFRPFEPHWTLVADPEKPVRWIMILFSPAVARLIPDGYRLLAPFYAVDMFEPLIPGSSPYAQTIQCAALAAVLEQEDGRPGWQAKQLMHFIDVLVALYRCYEESVRSRLQLIEGAEPGIVRAIEYLLRHFLEEPSIEEAIRLSGFARTWFYQSFVRVAGVSPGDFVTRLRIQHAAALLRQTDKPVTEVAFESGFQSLSYFNKCFKKCRGLAPSQYRNRS